MIDFETAKELCKTLEKQGKRIIITKRADDTPYLARYIIHRSPEQSIYIHRFLASDDATLHDHPWDGKTFIISGGYMETVAEQNEHGTFEKITYKREAGQFNDIGGHHIHRINIDKTYDIDDWNAPMTLFLGGPRYKSWGFYHFFGPTYTYVDHREYLGEKE